MANNYQSQVAEATTALSTIKTQVEDLDTAFGKLVATMNTYKGLTTPSGITSDLNKKNEVIKAANIIVEQQTKNTKAQVEAEEKLNVVFKSAIPNLTQLTAINKDYKAAQDGINNSVTSSIPTLQKLAAIQKQNVRDAQKEVEAKRQKIKATLDEQASIQSNKDALQRQKEAYLQLNRPYNQLLEQQRKAKQVLQDATIAQGKNSAETRKAQKEYDRLTTKVNQANQATSNFSKTGLGSVVSGLRNLMGAFGVVLGAQLFASIVKEVYSLVKTFDSLQFALERITGSMANATDSQSFLLDITTRFGAELVPTTNRWIKFLAAAKQSGLTLKDTEDIFRSMTKAAGVLGLKTDELQGIYLALEQMISKGKVTTEELRRQLGERLPGAMGIMAASMGVTIAQLDKMLKKGEVLSAEVLPAFAKAVELAYGIESVEKVDTLTAAQNRLTTSWQNFVKNVLSDSSLLREAYGWLSDLVKQATLKFGGNEAKIADETAKATDVIKAQYESRFRKLAEIELGQVGLSEHIKKEKLRIEAAYTDASLMKQSQLIGISETKRHEALDEEKSAILKQQIDLEKIKEKIAHDFAEKNLHIVKKEYDEELALATDFQNKAEKIKLLQKRAPGNSFKDFSINAFGDQLNKVGEAYGVVIDSQEKLDEALAKSNLSLGQATAKWNLFRKLAETGTVSLVEDEDGDGDKSQRLLKGILDLEKEIQIERLKNKIAFTKELIKSDLVSFKQRADLIKQNGEDEKRIIELEREIKKESLQQSFDDEKASLQASYDDKKLSKEKFDAQILALEKELAQNIILTNLDRDKKIISLNSDTEEELTKLREQAAEDKLDLIEKPFNEEKNKLNAAFQLTKKTTSDRKKLAKDLKDVEVRMAQARIDAEIAVIQVQIEGLKILGALGFETEEQINNLLAKIEKLNAGINITVDTDGIKEIEDTLKNFFEGFRDDLFNDAGFDKLNSMFLKVGENGKSMIATMIEDIDKLPDSVASASEKSAAKFAVYFNAITEVAQEAFNFIAQNQSAQFDAEYERLEKEKDIALQFAGESDAAKQQIEEQAEARKKAIQRREWKVQKQMAIINTVINTAQAVVSTFAQVPKFDFGISAFALASIIAGIGAAQVALISSQPTPEFFRGTMNAPEGVAMVDEKGAEVHTDRQGRVKSWGEDKANLRYLSAGDKIYKTKETYFKKELNTVLKANDIFPYSEMFGNMPSVVVENKGLTMNEMDMVMGRHFAKIQTNVTSIDKNGLRTYVKNQGGNTEKLNNRVTFKGFSV